MALLRGAPLRQALAPLRRHGRRPPDRQSRRRRHGRRVRDPLPRGLRKGDTRAAGGHSRRGDDPLPRAGNDRVAPDAHPAPRGRGHPRRRGDLFRDHLRRRRSAARPLQRRAHRLQRGALRRAVLRLHHALDAVCRAVLHPARRGDRHRLPLAAEAHAQVRRRPEVHRRGRQDPRRQPRGHGGLPAERHLLGDEVQRLHRPAQGPRRHLPLLAPCPHGGSFSTR